MSWRYKLYNIQPEQVVTIDPINDNFQPFIGELTGGLNEHNLDAATFTVSEFADDMCLRLHLSRPAVADIRVGLAGYSNPDLAGWVAIQSVDGWQSFTDDGLYKSFVGRGGSTWICASFNIHCGTGGTSWLGKPQYHQMGFGYLVALRINGAVLHETLLGSGDPSQDDFKSDGFTAASENTKNNNRSPLARDQQGGGGIAGARLPVVVDAVVDLLPGENIVEVVVMNIRGSMNKFAVGNPDPDLTYIGGPRELIIMEMVR
jgi:hypothetical protein